MIEVAQRLAPIADDPNFVVGPGLAHPLDLVGASHAATLLHFKPEMQQAFGVGGGAAFFRKQRA
jgi:hypothetical protein